MGVDGFLLVLCVGGALLALWVDARFPSLAPTEIWRALVRLVLVVAVGQLVVQVIELLLTKGVSPAAALLGVVLPTLVLFFLAAIWVMRALQAAVLGARR